MKIHSFNPQIAKEVGIECAILLYNIEFWIDKNKANDKNFYDGRYWTYNSTKAFSELFPYMSERVIYKALQKLVEKGYLVKGNFNKSHFDRTCWYALGDENPNYQIENSILPNGKIQNTKRKNDINVSDINQIKNSNININSPRVSKDTLPPEGGSLFENTCLEVEAKQTRKDKPHNTDKDFNEFWSLYPKDRAIDKPKCYRLWLKIIKEFSKEKMIEAIKGHLHYWQCENTPTQYIPHSTTWLNQQRYLNIPQSTKAQKMVWGINNGQYLDHDTIFK